MCQVIYSFPSMKILYICRLFSGFENSIKTGAWQPQGSPPVARMIESLDKSTDHQLCVVMAFKDYYSDLDLKKDQIKTLKGLNAPIHVLAGQKTIPAWLGKLRDKLMEMRQAWRIWKIYKEFQPDVVYGDRANILSLALLSRFTKTPVVWRVMGVIQIMHHHKKSRSLRSRIYKFLCKSPMSAAIWNMDGSGGQSWLETMTNKKTKKIMVFEGYDRSLAQESLPSPLPATIQNKTKILFAGRIEHLKGLQEFIDAMHILKENGQSDIIAIVAGYGSQEEWMQKEVQKQGLDDYFIFLGRLTPGQMKAARAASDVFVSCTTHGNLPNTTIEALCDGLCSLIPQANPETLVDTDTDIFIPADIVPRYGKQNDVVALAAKISEFHQNPAMRKKTAQNIKKFADETFVSWDERIKSEIQILEDLYAETVSQKSTARQV